MSSSLHDLRLAVRLLVRKPGFTAVSVLSLALGIGGTCAVFTVVYGVLLKDLPYRQPDRLVMVTETTPQRADARVSAPDFLDWRRESESFSGLAGFGSWAMRLTGEGPPRLIEGASVSSNFFEVLGVEAALGRTFDPDAGASENLRSVVLGHGLWSRVFGADRSIVGRSIRLDGDPYTVIGVLPAGFRFIRREADFWVTGEYDVPRYVSPQLASTVTSQRDLRYFRVLARLAPGTGEQQAQAELDTLMERLARAHPETNEAHGATLKPLRELVVGDVRRTLLLLLGAVALVQLIACANLAGLFLARSGDRQAELAVRASQGATRGSLVRQLLVEALLLAFLGGALGLAVATWGLKLLLLLVGDSLPRLQEIGLSMPVLAFTIGLSLLTGILVGLVPALRSSRPALRAVLAEGGVRGATARHQRLRTALVAAEVALALVLAAGAGLLLRSFLAIQQVELGFDPDGVLTMGVILPDNTYREAEEVIELQRRLLQSLEELPEVERAGLVVTLPFLGSMMRSKVEVEGSPLPEDEEAPTRYEVVSGSYFDILGIPLLRGRSFGREDAADGPPVVIVNRRFADRYFPGEDPLGRRIAVDSGSERPWRTIVGVVGDAHHRSLEEPVQVEAYVPYQQRRSTYFNLVVEGRSAPALLEDSVRRQVATLDAELPVFDVLPLSDRVTESLAERKFLVWLAGLFALLALVLSTVGAYGLMAYSVARRTQEIGIRVVLGAKRPQVLGEILKSAALIGGTGVLVGLTLALALGRSLRSLLFGVEPIDPTTLVLVAGLLLVATIVAAYLPARRAASIDPADVLRRG